MAVQVLDVLISFIHHFLGCTGTKGQLLGFLCFVIQTPKTIRYNPVFHPGVLWWNCMLELEMNSCWSWEKIASLLLLLPLTPPLITMFCFLFYPISTNFHSTYLQMWFLSLLSFLAQLLFSIYHPAPHYLELQTPCLPDSVFNTSYHFL